MRYRVGMLFIIIGYFLIAGDYFVMARDLSMDNMFLLNLIVWYGVEAAVIMWITPFFGGLFLLITSGDQ